MCMMAALEDGAPYRLCLLALLHDAHEFVIGDMVSPASQALSELMYEVGFTFLPDDGLLAIKALKERTDAAIFAAVGLDLPSEEAHAYIKRLDNEVLMTELDAMQGEQPDTADSASELVARRPFVPGRWPPKEAARQFLDRLQRYISIPEERRCGEARTDSAKEVEKCSNEASPISV